MLCSFILACLVAPLCVTQFTSSPLPSSNTPAVEATTPVEAANAAPFESATDSSPIASSTTTPPALHAPSVLDIITQLNTLLLPYTVHDASVLEESAKKEYLEALRASAVCLQELEKRNPSLSGSPFWSLFFTANELSKILIAIHHLPFDINTKVAACTEAVRTPQRDASGALTFAPRFPLHAEGPHDTEFDAGVEHKLENLKKLYLQRANEQFEKETETSLQAFDEKLLYSTQCFLVMQSEDPELVKNTEWQKLWFAAPSAQEFGAAWRALPEKSRDEAEQCLKKLHLSEE